MILIPGIATTHNDRGLAYAKLGQLDQAILDFDEAIRIEPQLAAAYNNRGFAYRDLDQLLLAIDNLDQAISLDSEFQLAYYNRALVNILLGLDSAAEEDGRRAVELGFDSGLLTVAIAALKDSRQDSP
jgi:tetratricopeptide (TPR) repeat protein